MPETVPPVLETARLQLRPPAAADLGPWTARIFADPAVTRYVPSRIADPRERAERMLAAITASWARRGFGTWLLIDRADGRLIGHCGLGYLPDTDEVEIDYALAQDAWGQGYATEAARVTLEFGFTRAGLAQIIGLVVPEHTPSRRVLERVGFFYRGEAPYFGLTMARYTLSAAEFAAAGGGRP